LAQIYQVAGKPISVEAFMHDLKLLFVYSEWKWTEVRKVHYPIHLFKRTCENCPRQSCKALIGLTNCAKMIGGGRPLYLKFWIKVTALERNRRFSIYFRS